MDHNKAFGQALREHRLRKRQSQESLAFDAGLDRTYISLLELGQRSPTLSTISALCKALDIKSSTIVLRMEEIMESNID